MDIPPHLGTAPYERGAEHDKTWRETFDLLIQNQRDILFLLRTIHVTSHNQRVPISPETAHIHCQVLRMEPFNGRCPCCLETKVVSEKGERTPPAQFDHFFGRAYSAPIHTWLICIDCHTALSNDTHMTWYHRLTTRFRAYQAATEAYTKAFANRTPARIRVPTRDVIP